MSGTPPSMLLSSNGGGKEKERSRSKDRSRGDRDKDKDRDKKRRDRDRDSRDRDGGSSRRRDRDSRERDRDRDRERDRDRDSRSNRSRSRNHDDYDRRRSKRSRSRDRDRDRKRDRDSRSRRSSSRGGDYERSRRRRTRSRSYERHRSDRDRSSRDRDRTAERSHVNPFDTSSNNRISLLDQEIRLPSLFDRQAQMPTALETIREEPRESRFDLSQTIQELMGNAGVAKGFASFFNSQNSNDSTSNGALDSFMESAADRKRKRKSRWGGSENDKTFIPGMPTILPSTLDPAQQEAYLDHRPRSLSIVLMVNV
ncbi:U1 small nuclear ribonucleoprotein 70 kDa isoform X2 [Drosophila willistoni]|uniref:U1 small nuclear ribonucleoprotein 70 kDa isoform X2 n=1 Tax=Drosophila willistoni TaxID=7260 RepID=UPI000C26D346|nr:U1 small nuclear ribonucleoprotein 70 kDa isoform X2 [Drosophila willistoni]